MQIGRHRFTGRADIIGPEHDDYVRLWALVNNTTRGRYDRYQQQTERKIELVRLHPRRRPAQ